MTHEEIQAELSSFALGALDTPEQRAVEAHLATGCAACRQELGVWEAVVGSLALAGPEGDAPDLKPALLQRVHPARRRGTVITLPRWSLLPLAAAAAVLLIVGVTHDASLREQLQLEQQQVASLRADASGAQQQMERLAQQLAAKENDVAALRAALAAAQESLAIVQQRGLQMVRLQPQVQGQPSPGTHAEAHALIDSETGRSLFYAFDLPEVPADKTYELWWITEKEGPVRAGLFIPDQRGFGRLEGPLPLNVGAIQAAAVTIEPTGGVAKPTGPMVLKPVRS